MDEKKVLIVDDDKNICGLIELYLSNAGFGVQSCHDGKTALMLVQKYRYSLVLLDVMLPDMQGFEVCGRIREVSDIPVIMLTARDMLEDKIQGFHSGADDYIVKPFEPMELIARINARLKQKRNHKTSDEETLAIGNITLDIKSYEVKKNGVIVDLKPKEIQLFHFLLCNKNIVFSRDTLLQKVWNYDISGDTRTVDVHIKSLRKKLCDEHNGWKIKTVFGVGYKLEV